MAKDDFFTLLTHKVINYVETPRATRKEARKARLQVREPWSTRWFGMIPVSFSIWWRKSKINRWKRLR